MTCSWDSPESLHTDRRTHALSDLTIHIPDSFSSECGTLITAELRESEKMVMQLITTVTDMKRVFDNLKAEEDAVKQAQQRQREQLYQQEKITNRSSRLQTQTLR